MAEKRVRGKDGTAGGYGKSRLGPFLIGGVLFGAGLGFLIHNLFAGVLMGAGVGYVLDIVVYKK